MAKSILVHPHTEPYEQPPLFGIDFVPAKVRGHGLREAHTWPHVSRGKRPDGGMTLFRVPAAKAWGYPEIELRSATAWPCLILDLDRPDHYDEVLDRCLLQGTVPTPNWVVRSLDTGRCHAVYTLERPVLRSGPKVRENPLKVYARVSEWLAQVLDADRAYNGPTAHNPMPAAHGPDRDTAWLRQDGWHLQSTAQAEGLADWIPQGWRIPAKVELRTEGGRNYALYRAAAKWAGYRCNLDTPALDYLRELNRELPNPLGEVEVRGIARNIERYRERDMAKGWHRPSFFAVQAARGRKSGKARKRKTAERNEAIRDMLNEGHTQAAVARHFGLSRQWVNRLAADGSLDTFNERPPQVSSEPTPDDVPARDEPEVDVSRPSNRVSTEEFGGGQNRRQNVAQADEEHQLRNRARAALAAWAKENDA